MNLNECPQDVDVASEGLSVESQSRRRRREANRRFELIITFTDMKFNSINYKWDIDELIAEGRW